MIYIPVRDSSVFTQTLQNKKPWIVNDPAKDRATVNEVRDWVKTNEKMRNLMIIPVGENQGKHGGAIIILLINKFLVIGIWEAIYTYHTILVYCLPNILGHFCNEM